MVTVTYYNYTRHIAKFHEAIKERKITSVKRLNVLMTTI